MKRNGIIIGGGAAGLMAAIAAAEAGAFVTILEHMPRVGKKILSTGNGKCNLTNLKLTPEGYRSSDPEFVRAVLSEFAVSDTLAFFRRLGVRTTDRNGYVYPASGQAQTILDALRERAEELSVSVVCDCQTERILISNREAQEQTVSANRGAAGQKPPAAAGRQLMSPGFTVITNQGTFTADFLILAAGGMTARVTGSDGSGYVLAKNLGHSIKKPLPALVQLRCQAGYLKAIAGVRTEARVSLYEEAKKTGPVFLAEDAGELQLTEYGISGIPVFQVSRYASEALDRGRAVTAVIDLYPSLPEQELFCELKLQRKYLEKRSAETFLNGFFHKKIAAVLLKLAGISPKTAVGTITDRQLIKLTEEIKALSLPVTATNPPEQAQVTMGGVRVNEVDPRTMESRFVPGLYLAGEILDVDGICGGYNLQWAWSSGYIAGTSAANGGEYGGTSYDTHQSANAPGRS